MKKKLLTMLLAGCMVVSLTACGNTTENVDDTKTEQSDAADDSEEEETDGIDTSARGTSTLTELGEYKGITYTQVDTTPTDNEVETQVQYLLSSSYDESAQDVVTETSYVNIDYEGKKDGVAFDGGTAQSQELSIENSGYIDGFAESIVGMKVGETKDCPMTFPEDYGVEELNGAEVVFTITVNECWERIPATLNDEFAQGQGYENVDALYAGIKESLEDSKQQEAESEREYELLEKIIDNSTFDITDEEVQLYVEQMMSQYESMASSYYGVDLETYVTNALGMTMDEYEEQCEIAGTFTIQETLIKKAIAEKEGIVLSEEDYTVGAETYMNYYGYTDLTEFEEAVGKDNLEEQLLMDKAMAFIVENAVAEAE